MSEFQVVFFEKFLAIGTANPFDNKSAIKNLFDELPDASAFIFLEFYPSVSFSGSSYGVGTSSAYFTMRIKIINRQLDTILKANISGSSASKFNVNGKDFNSDEISNSFEDALETLIMKIEKKLSKKVAKIKW